MLNQPHVLTRRQLGEATAAAAIAVSGRAVARAAAAPEAQRRKPYPIYRAGGDHRALGRQHGEQARDQIVAHREYMRRTMGLTSAELRRRALSFTKLFEKHCPHLIEEIRGLAEGARIEFADALAANIRGALTQSPEGGCTAFVVAPQGATDGKVLIGQNSDMLPAVMDFAYVLHLKPKGKPEMLMWSFGGMIGYHGINDRGVGQFANDVGGGPQPRFAMPHYPLKRLMMESSSLAEVKRKVRGFPVWANGNYVLCDGGGRILDLETTTAGAVPVDDRGAGFIAHSNHFVAPRYATKKNFELSAPDSFSRLKRMNQLLAQRFGKLSAADVKKMLRDRAGDPTGICRSAQTTDKDASWVTAGITVASIVAEPGAGKLHVAAGNRPDAVYVTYSMDE